MKIENCHPKIEDRIDLRPCPHLLVTIIIVMIILIMKVLLHTVIDWMRTEDEGEDGRNINHHGKTITVGGKQDAVAADIEGVRLMT